MPHLEHGLLRYGVRKQMQHTQAPIGCSFRGSTKTAPMSGRQAGGRFFSAAASLPTLAFSSPPGRIAFPRGISPSAPAPSPPLPRPAIHTSIFHFPHYHSLSREGVVIGPTSTGLEEPNSKWHCNPMSQKNNGILLNNLHAVLCVSCFFLWGHHG